MDVPSNELLRRALLFVGAVLLLFSVVLTEPQTAADMAVVTVGAVMVIVGLYLSRRAETTAVEKAEREKAALEAEPDRRARGRRTTKEEPFRWRGVTQRASSKTSTGLTRR